MYLQQFQDCDDDVVDVAEPRGLEFLCMVKPARPIDSNVTLLSKERQWGEKAKYGEEIKAMTRIRQCWEYTRELEGRDGWLWHGKYSHRYSQPLS